MTELNLTATDDKQKTVLEHLIPMVSDELAEKINNGVFIEKDGKRLLNKKDLATFMDYATEQAKKTLSEQQRTGKQTVCVHGDDIMSWAIHYFEEDSIEGKLYNEDGTEYKPPKPAVKKTAAPAVPYTPPKPKPEPQLSMFDMLSEKPEEKPSAPVEDDDEETDDEDFTAEELEEIYAEEQVREVESEPKGSPMYRSFAAIKAKYKDCLVFYRLGDFYEMLGEDAITCANELDLTLTGRDCGLKERVPMTGVPFHAADNYIAKLVGKGFKVAVVEPLGNGKPNIERVIEPKPVITRAVDEETDIEELSETEMRNFDGDIEEPDEIITVSKILGETEETDDFDIEKEREIARAFDKDALVILSDLLGGNFIME